MPRPRIPLAALMLAVALAAVDIAAIQHLFRFEQSSRVHNAVELRLDIFATALLPFASLLLGVALGQGRSFWKSGQVGPFVLGFEVCGWATVFAATLAAAIRPDWPAQAINDLFPWQWLSSIYPASLAPDWLNHLIGWGLVIATFGLPALALALAGGWLSRRAGITLRIEGRSGGGPAR